MENDEVVRLVTALKESLEQEIHAVETRLEQKIGDRVEAVETKLLTEFQKWAAPAEAVRRSHSVACP